MKKKTICLRVKSKIGIGIKTISETTQDASYESFRYKIKGKGELFTRGDWEEE